jgi:Secretion system C-terminal sorting domain
MKQIILSIITLLLLQTGFSQLRIETGAHWVTTGNPVTVLENMSFYNNGNFNAGAGTFKFTGNSNNGMTGTVQTFTFATIEIAKTNNAIVSLARSININNELKMTSGVFDIMSSQLFFGNGGTITGETETNRVTASGPGFIQITQNLNAPNAVNPGNLGAVISSSANLGSVLVRRFHFERTGTGLSGSIKRSYTITPQNNASATLRFRYFDAELNGQTESNLSLYQSNFNGASWDNQMFTTRDANLNFVEKTGLSSLSMFTLGNNAPLANGVTGLIFTASLSKQNTANLSWSTSTETNMQGYQVERRRDNEAVFSNVGYVASKAINGNSSTALSYAYSESNTYTGTTTYRLRILDKTGGFTFSNEQSITPKSKGKPVNAAANKSTTPQIELLNEAAMTVGPNPNNGNFFFNITGITEPVAVALYTADGKLVQTFKVNNNQRQQVNGMKAGVYILKTSNNSLPVQKIIVQ